MIEMTVSGMSCNHCKAAITQAVHSVDPSAQVQADVETQKVSVQSQADVQALKAAVEEAGYPVKDVQRA